MEGREGLWAKLVECSRDGPTSSSPADTDTVSTSIASRRWTRQGGSKLASSHNFSNSHSEPPLVQSAVGRRLARVRAACNLRGQALKVRFQTAN
ncbi:unnamed protein product [Protopolystoma xenopodis]|uniref:Uncharacterized protein n=1 Tax=Protopolystoma xenopodis TaxID=117903 RepID=A0A448X150_9PLAT|nr:unnamed protein product [Protopolystoma xenopodis]